MIEADAPYMRTLAAGEPLAAMIGGKSSLVWAKAEVIYDSPEKGKVQDGEQGGRLLRHRLGEVANGVKTELLIVSPYLVPVPAGMKFFDGLRERGVIVRILTNSLDRRTCRSFTRGTRRFGNRCWTRCLLYEVRPVPGQPTVRGNQLKSPSSGRYALHAKVFVFDRQRVFIGSMNLDQRSLYSTRKSG
jgi:putative cardiolipin synthase